MHKFFKKISLFLLLTIGSLNAAETGTVSVFSIHNGEPLLGTEVTVDASKTYKTDKDGFVQIELTVGQHQIEMFAKDLKSNNLGYLKKPVIIKESRDTQIIATFKSESVMPDVKIDVPVGELEKQKNYLEGATGTLNGVVVTSDKSEPIANARVFVKGTSSDSKTDANGKFSIKIPADTNVSISVVHSEYSAQTLNNIVVAKDKTTTAKIELTPASLELEEFVVLAPKVEGSIANVMAEEKTSNAITNIVGSDQMSKKGDSDAASALKRVTGVTLIGGKNIYVRGLGDRYSNVEMNSMPLPSPDPTKRVVPLDIFPSGVIESMKVQKSATADIPSNFGGGYVDIRTKDSAKDDYLKVSVEARGNSNTGKDVYTYQGSDSDWTGYDDGYRQIDPSILEATQVIVGERIKGFTTDYYTKDEIADYTSKFANRSYDVTQEKLPFGKKISLEGAVNYVVADDHKISLFGNYEYGQENKYREDSYAKYDFDSASGGLKQNPTQYGTISRTTTEYVNSGIFNIGYNYLDVFKIKYTKLYTHNADMNTRVVDGILGSNDDTVLKYYLDWEERTLDADQISGQFDYSVLNVENNFRFGYENAIATLYQPNNYEYAYIYDNQNNRYFFDTKDFYPFGTSLESTDDLTAFYLNNKINAELMSEDDYLDIGFSSSYKERTSRLNRYALKRNVYLQTPFDYNNVLIGNIDGIYDTYVRPDISFDERILVINSVYKAADYFDAEVKDTNMYAQTFTKPTDDIEVLLGARQVDLSQTVYQFQEDRVNPGRLMQRNPEEFTLNKLYPSLSVKYKLNQDNHIDFAYSQTFIIPDLREFTSGSYVHPYDVATIVGNPNLVNTDIENYDLKYSHYFSDTENVKAGLFYKYLDKPIEDTMQQSSSLPIYSFDNSDFATLYGIELDGRKSFDYIDNSLNDLFLSGNFSYTNSDVSLREEQIDLYSSNHRQLQGLSQIVINLSLAYEIKYRSVVLSYNKMGERIRKVGMIETIDDVQYKYPDDVEIPPQLVDFVWIEKYKKDIELKLKLGNLLDEETIWKQASSVTNRFKTGITYSAGLSYKY